MIEPGLQFRCCHINIDADLKCCLLYGI